MIVSVAVAGGSGVLEGTKVTVGGCALCVGLGVTGGIVGSSTVSVAAGGALSSEGEATAAQAVSSILKRVIQSRMLENCFAFMIYILFGVFLSMGKNG
jgi:hypothetical protein